MITYTDKESYKVGSSTLTGNIYTIGYTKGSNDVWSLVAALICSECRYVVEIIGKKKARVNSSNATAIRELEHKVKEFDAKYKDCIVKYVCSNCKKKI